MGRDEEARVLADIMVRTQIAARGVADPAVLAAMRKVPRHRFAPDRDLREAYGDHPLAIGRGQTISQPYIVALMTELLHLRGGGRALEVGTGSGYQAAVLAAIGARVVTIERIPELSARAGKLLAELGYGDVALVVGDGSRGYPPRAPYDGILVAAATPRIPRGLAAQLADGGRLAIPLGEADGDQTLVVATRVGARLVERAVIGCRFVPLILGGA